MADTLLRRISAGEWAIGDRLPTERELAVSHGVGINTVRRAVGMLERAGLVRRAQGSGTYLLDIPGPNGPGPGKPLMGVVLPAAKYYTPGIVEGIGDGARQAGWQVLISYSTFEPALELERCHELLTLGVRGLVLSPSFHQCDDPEQHLARLQGLGVPIVLVDRRPPTLTAEQTSYVATDRESAAHIAVRRFVELGRRRVGYFGTHGANSGDVRDAFGRALTAFDLPTVPGALVERRPWTRQDVADYVTTCRESKVDAVLCMDDRKALLLLPALLAAGLGVPDDVSVIAYDDAVHDLAAVPLTTVSPPKFEVGRRAAEFLVHQITHGAAAAICHAEMQPRLVVRDSCTPER
ncbi:substrate-binding domain-containing protein [Microlunatus sp. Y2014]|uniref:LacI family DNA-binding transcriptional regulator n=1 Tax=Microlunatus sp. Y2014 TaxID=3418488 RepID=UPI003DA6E539